MCSRYVMLTAAELSYQAECQARADFCLHNAALSNKAQSSTLLLLGLHGMFVCYEFPVEVACYESFLLA